MAETGAHARRLTAHCELVSRATGDHAGARKALSVARDRLRIQAGKIADPALRRGFLEDVPENVRTLALAQEWLGDGDLALS